MGGGKGRWALKTFARKPRCTEWMPLLDTTYLQIGRAYARAIRLRQLDAPSSVRTTNARVLWRRGWRAVRLKRRIEAMK